jgi:hypothetical protein
MALPMLTRPPDLEQYLTKDIILPEYGSTSWESDEASTTAESEVNTGLVGYEMVSVTHRSADGRDETPYTEAEYDPETGIVTFPVQSAAGLRYEIDAYKDGSFQVLDYSKMRLFSLAVAVVWDERFDRNWLNMQMKIKDSSFATAAEGQYTEKINQRMLRNRALLSDELRKYEQDVYYQSRVPDWRRPTVK